MNNPIYHRRNLPHIHAPLAAYFITFRLHGSIPVSQLKELHEKHQNKSDAGSRIFLKYDTILDRAIYGPRYLSTNSIAQLTKDALHHYDGRDYDLLSYCIMSNHVHVAWSLLEGSRDVSEILHSIKRFTARKANQILKRTKLSFWQSESFDRIIRNRTELIRIIRYILNNPIKAGLVESWNDWPHSYVKDTSLLK